ncbi:LysR family transcriptional regulator [Silvanigrella sp.]|jgi:DNA-binding transcriptional LysR family regulator|uniref:LysR family transcriptional regulator n=1 Tax=Silvanigrella sp. TaxID=2024976 RepID=UPI0037C868FD
MKISNLDDIYAFLYIYQERSFTEAAKKLKISKAAISNKINNLEEKFGFPLFIRSTRNVTPTQDALVLFQYAQKLIDSLKEFESSLNQSQEMQGKIHLTCSTAIATSFIGEQITKFLSLYPKIKIELTVTDSYLDLIENNIDLAIRIGNLESTSLHGKKMGSNKLIFCATPSYLNKFGTPQTLTDLKKHNLVFLEIHERILFKNSKIKLGDYSELRTLISNQSNVLNQYAIEGQAIAIRSYWDLKKYLLSKELIEIHLEDQLEDYGSVWLLTPTGKLQNNRVKTLFNFLSKNWINQL